jgi:hypothetical protein
VDDRAGLSFEISAFDADMTIQAHQNLRSIEDADYGWDGRLRRLVRELELVLIPRIGREIGIEPVNDFEIRAIGVCLIGMTFGHSFEHISSDLLKAFAASQRKADDINP